MNQPRTARDRVDRAFALLRRMGRFVVPAVVLCVLGCGAAVAWSQLVHQRTYKSEAMILYRDPDGARLQETALSRSRLEQIITSARLYGGIIADRGMPDAIDEMRTHLRLRQHEADTYVLSFEDTDPKRAQAVAAQLADALVVDNARPVADPTPEAAMEAFARERSRLEAELSRKEAALALFVSKHPEFSKEARAPRLPPPQPRPAPTAKNDSTMAMLERETQRLQERLAQPSGVAKKDPQADPALVSAKQSADAELAAAQRDLADKQANFTEQHPDVRAARDKVKVAQDKAKRADDAVAASLAAAQQNAAASQEDEGYIDRGALENQLKRIQDEMAEYKKRKAENAAPTTPLASTVVAQEAEWTRLNRELTDVHERMAALRDQEAKAPRVEAAPRNAQMAVIEAAYLPSHEEAPDHRQVMYAGIAASVLLSLLVMLGLALIDDHIYDRVDVERLGVPLVGVVPRSTGKAVKHG